MWKISKNSFHGMGVLRTALEAKIGPISSTDAVLKEKESVSPSLRYLLSLVNTLEFTLLSLLKNYGVDTFCSTRTRLVLRSPSCCACSNTKAPRGSGDKLLEKWSCVSV